LLSCGEFPVDSWGFSLYRFRVFRDTTGAGNREILKFHITVWATLLAAVLIPNGTAFATTITVDIAGGGDFTQLQPAVVAAAPGDTVAVRPGQYLGNVKILQGLGGFSIIGPSPEDMAVVMADTFGILVGALEQPLHFENLEIRGGRLRGALHFAGGQATVLNCALRENHSTGGCSDVGGGAALYYGSDVRFENCLFENNTGWDAAGGLIVWDSRADVIGCTFRGNQACYGGSLEFYHCHSGYSSGFEPSVVEYSLFHGNTATELGGALMTVDSSPIIRFNTFVDNDSPIGSALRLMQGEPVIENNVITGSDIPITCVQYEDIPAAEPLMGRNLVWGHGGVPVQTCTDEGDLVTADPGYCDPEGGDFRVCADSPCLEDGQVGAFGAGCGACLVPVDESSMGSLKAMFR
jgi:hypothetical protein